jgi:hypothetical protein
MHGHAIQLNLNLQLQELYALERAAAKKRADEVRKKLRFASASIAESTSEDCIVELQSREESEGQEQAQSEQTETSLRKDKELPTSKAEGNSLSSWA